MRLAIHAPSLGLSLPDNPFGKDVANRGLYSALSAHGGFEHIVFRTAEQPSLITFSQQFSNIPRSSHLSLSSLTDTACAVQAGTLLRGQPYLSELAWERGTCNHHSYSLVGLIHTLAPPKVRELIGDVLLAPVQPWDALVCTSPSVRQCLEEILDGWQEYLLHRFGGSRAVRPQLPLLPLGVDQADLFKQRANQESRNFLRHHLQIAEHDVLVLWLGRLSFFEKAYPQAMFISLQKAAQRCASQLHFVMAGWFPGGDSDHRAYREAADTYCPQVPVHFLDGKNPDVVSSCWAASDVFLSLVDNPQETFGLAPVEAMAAGLPVVVSDWDGYRYTVTDGVEGFRIPTLLPSASPVGAELASSHDFGLLSYQDYVGAVAQHVAVDTDAAAAVIARLADDPLLRNSLGVAGRQTVKQRFDWPVVARLHHQLYAELAERRRDSQIESKTSPRHPLRDDPFRTFAPFSTSLLGPRTELRLKVSLSEALHRLNNLTSLDRCYEHLHGSQSALHQLLAELEACQGCALENLLALYPADQHCAICLSITWLAKLGLIQWSHPPAPR